MSKDSTPSVTPRSQAFEQYQALYAQLLILIAAGKHDSIMGDDIRADADAPWYAMTDEERAYFNNVLDYEAHPISQTKSRRADTGAYDV